MAGTVLEVGKDVSASDAETLVLIGRCIRYEIPANEVATKKEATKKEATKKEATKKVATKKK